MIHNAWSETSWETRRAWREIRQYMIQQNLIEMLGQLLLQIERISAQGFNVVWKRRMASDMPGVPFSEKGILALICMYDHCNPWSGRKISLFIFAKPKSSSICPVVPYRTPSRAFLSTLVCWASGLTEGPFHHALKGSMDPLLIFLHIKQTNQPSI